MGGDGGQSGSGRGSPTTCGTWSWRTHGLPALTPDFGFSGGLWRRGSVQGSWTKTGESRVGTRRRWTGLTSYGTRPQGGTRWTGFWTRARSSYKAGLRPPSVLPADFLPCWGGGTHGYAGRREPTPSFLRRGTLTSWFGWRRGGGTCCFGVRRRV